MKNSKFLLSILLVITMVFFCTSSFAISVSALTEDDEILLEIKENLGGEAELRPMVARGCSSIVKKYDSLGNIYSVTFYNKYGFEEARIDYQGTPHFIDGEYRLPHQHNYTYHFGPNGEGPSRTDNPTYTNFRTW